MVSWVRLVLHPHGIAPTFLKVVAGGGFYSYYIQQGNKSDKEWKILRKKIKLIQKNLYIF